MENYKLMSNNFKRRIMYKYNLEEIWHQAKNDNKSIEIEYVTYTSYIFKGIKIVKEGKNISIYNTKKMGLSYDLISEEHYYVFLQFGFRAGVYHVLKSTYLDMIDVINHKIKKEINNQNNRKQYKKLKTLREELINKYSKISKSI